MLTREELAGKAPVELENMLRARFDELKRIRAKNGGTEVLPVLDREDVGPAAVDRQIQRERKRVSR